MRHPLPFARTLLCAGLTTIALTGCRAAPVPDAGEVGALDWYARGQATLAEAERLRPNTRRAKNVILFVGDGMGVSTVTAARILEGQRRGADGESNRLAFERFPYLAHSVTASANQQTPDSAPTATAMVTGIKTRDGAVSVDASIDRNEPSADVTAAKSVVTLLEQAEQRGLSTGVVSTARITHATPAVNYAHVSDRNWEADSDLPADATVKDIARQLLEFPHGDGLEVALGGGRSYFYDRSSPDPEYPEQSGRRADGRNLHEEWVSQYPQSAYVWDQASFDAVDPATTKHLLGLFEPSHMQFEADRAQDPAGEPSLADMTEKAIEVLRRNAGGFYLLVEGGRIDHGHHAGNAYRALTDTIALSEAVATATRMTNPDDTLIVVTADHSHVLTIAGYPERGNPILGKAAFDGEALTDTLGLPYTTLGYANGPGWTGGTTRDGARPDLSDVDTSAPDYRQEAAVPTSAETHAGEDVAIYASGPQAHLLHGTVEQNVIYHVMAKALGFERKAPR